MKPSYSAVLDGIENYTGFCLACGNEQDGVEPDAQRYECEACGERQVFGAEAVLLGDMYAMHDTDLPEEDEGPYDPTRSKGLFESLE